MPIKASPVFSCLMKKGILSMWN